MRFAPVALIAALLPATLYAQSRVTGGDIQGTVSDPAGAAVGGASVTVVNAETNVTRTTDTDEKGRYFFAALPPGRYSLSVSLLGFAEEKFEDIVLQLGHSVDKDFRLRLTGAPETVTVVAEPPSLDARRVAVAFSVGEQQIEGLPINGRNFVDFAALTPGVTTDRATTRGIIATSGLSFTGQPARSNSLTVDGFDNNDVTTGGVRGQFSQEAIREFQVLTDSYSAEFGRASGGVVNIVTKSGTNDVHGNAFLYFRDERLNAKEHFEKFDVFGNAIQQEKAPFSRYQYGATLGGPLVKDRTFYFLSFERLDVRREQLRDHRPCRRRRPQPGRLPGGAGLRGATRSRPRRRSSRSTTSGRPATAWRCAAASPTPQTGTRSPSVAWWRRATAASWTPPTGSSRPPRPTSSRRAGSASRACSSRARTRSSTPSTPTATASVKAPWRAGPRCRSWAWPTSAASSPLPSRAWPTASRPPRPSATSAATT